MIISAFEKGYQKSMKLIQSPNVLPVITAVLACGVIIYAPETFALSEGNKVAELKALTDETSKIVKNFSHLIGLGSIVTGVYSMVASQNLKAAAIATVVSLAAFKGPDFFTTTSLI